MRINNHYLFLFYQSTLISFYSLDNNSPLKHATKSTFYLSHIIKPSKGGPDVQRSD